MEPMIDDTRVAREQSADIKNVDKTQPTIITQVPADASRLIGAADGPFPAN